VASGVDVQAIVEAAVAKKTAEITADLGKAHQQLLYASEELDKAQKRAATQKLFAMYREK
jgi:hypothetical protein